MTIPRGTSLPLPFGALAALAAIALAAFTHAPAAAAAPVPIGEGELVWGIKESWRSYIGPGAVSEGAVVNPDGTYAFPVASGSYDEETKTTTLEFDGRVQWRSYPDFLGPGKWGLDTTFTDLSLEISPAAQVIRGTHIGYLRDDPGGALHEDTGVVLAKLRIDGATTSFADGLSSWTAVPALAGPGFSLYTEGTVLDPATISYTGPGGAPDLGEKWDEPGEVVLAEGGRWISPRSSAIFTQRARQAFASGADGVVHIAEINGAGTEDAVLTISAHDPETLEPLGAPVEVTYPNAFGHYFKLGFDPATDSLFYVTSGEGPGGDGNTLRRATWNPAAEGYDLEPVGQLPNALASLVGSVAWNPARQEVAVVTRALTSSGFGHIADLLTFRKQSGTWAADADPLVVPATGQLEGLSKKIPAGLFATGLGLEGNALAVARDGSYVQAPGATSATVAAGAKVWLPALRILPDWDGSATVSPLWETQLPVEAGETYYSWSAARPGADGSVLLHAAGQRRAGYQRVDVDENGAAVVDAVLDAPQGELPINWFASSVAADPGRGWEWATDFADPDAFNVFTMVGDEVVSRFSYPEATNEVYPAIDVGPDGALYLPVRDEETGRYGYQRLAVEGVLASFAEQPAAASVSLGPDEPSEQVSFTSTVAGGDPAPTRRWQVRAAGEHGFADIPGESGATLTVAARPADDGNAYRAVYESAAGAIASAAAELSVEYAPRIVADPRPATVEEGADAVFLVAADANPELEVVWQRRVAGFWESIGVDDDNFVVNGPSLTVVETNTDQSGALFRAKLLNDAGTAFSKQARLTVEPATTIPAEGVDLDAVSLEWSGNPELQKAPPFGGSSYFSAGVSAGDEATYSAASGNARIFQRDAGGAEALASWATRAAHVGGGTQLVRLYGGSGRIEADGSTAVSWRGSFTVNFYGGLVPFSFTDPELLVDSSGEGTLSADLLGCASSQSNPDECVPFAAQPDVTFATFSGVEVDPAGAVEIAPEYAGVEVEIGGAAAPQNRTAPGWGAWPQPFVDFHATTGLVSYWYSSGGAFDPDKPPAPFLVEFAGEALPEPPPGGDSQPLPAPPAGAPPAAGSRPPSLRALGGSQGVRVRRGGLAVVARVSCAGPLECSLRTRSGVWLAIAGKRYRATLLAPRELAAGESAAVRLRLSRAARKALRGGTARATLWIGVRSGESVVTRRLGVRLRG